MDSNPDTEKSFDFVREPGEKKPLRIGQLSISPTHLPLTALMPTLQGQKLRTS